MNLEIFVLCDAANDSAGKLNLIGAFNTLTAQQLPALHPFCVLAVRLRAERAEQGAHQLQLNAKRPDGVLLIPPIGAPLNIAFPNPNEPAIANLFFGLAGLQFLNYGTYTFELLLDGKIFASTPLIVKKP